MPEFSAVVLDVARRVIHRREATEQGGLLNGQDPTAVNTADPLRLWIVQVGVIVLTTQLLGLALGKIKQPKVIAEVLAGILLGPTAFGRIPGFTEHIFPVDSRPFLSLVANIGLCLFLFLVGLEIDAAVIKRNARLSVTVALAGMCLPFGLGAALSIPLYRTFIDQSVKFTNFMLFTGVAYSITAFPVLCRILTELKILDTTVGIVVLSAGVGNDIVGWTLLALSVALVNAGSGLMALWILLVCVGWALFMLFIMKRILYWLARRTGSIRDGPTMFFMTVTMLLVFGSALFTDIIGVHAIFGAFLAGLIVPRDGGLAISLTEKLEDMVSIIFLPLYFMLSGLSTDLGLLNNGITWGFTIAICSLSYFGKFTGCTVAAKVAGFSWREASTIGSLMSCKGLVELIVLNVGLSAGILSQRVFSMFVLEALVLTFMTTPAVVLLYPPELRVRASATGANFANADAPEATDDNDANMDGSSTGRIDDTKSRFTVVLDKLEHLPGMMAITQLILPPPPPYTGRSLSTVESSTELDGKGVSPPPPAPPVSIDAIRLIELSDRTSAVMKGSNIDSLTATDPVLDIFTTFGALHGAPVSSSLSIVPFDDLGATVSEQARRTDSHLILVPWLPPHHSIGPHDHQPHSPSHPQGALTTPLATPRVASHMQNPFEALFRATAYGAEERDASISHSQFVRALFASARTDVALFVDRHTQTHTAGGNAKAAHGGTYRLLVPFFGGPDDRLALDFAVQLCANPKISATVVRVRKAEAAELVQGPGLGDKDKPPAPPAYSAEGADVHQNTVTIASVLPDTVYGHATTQTRLQSETADNITWARYTRPADPTLTPALGRMTFLEEPSSTPLRAVLERAGKMSKAAVEERSRLLVLAGRSRRLAVENHHAELKALAEEYGGVGGEVKRTVGDVATALVVSRCQANVVVFQAALAPESE